MAICLALGLLLPFVTGQIPVIGKALSPMHIPVFICGMMLGPVYGGILGFVLPLLRSGIFGMPAIMPDALAMAPELMTYGILAGVLLRLLPKRNIYVPVALVGSMIGGRLVWGVMRLVLTAFTGEPFTLAMFLAGGFTNALPGIVLHILIVPPIVIALRRAGLGLTG